MAENAAAKTTIIGISGSLRKASLNTTLLRAAAAAVPAGVTVEIDTIRGIPLYDGDVEAESGIPAAAAALKDRVAAADALLIVTPEYNNSIPGVLKNAIDWMSRPPADSARVFANKPVAIMGASPGRWGTILSQAAWLPVMRTLGALLWTGGRLQVAGAGKVFDPSGAIVDDAVAKQLATFMTGFVTFVGEQKRARPVSG